MKVESRDERKKRLLDEGRWDAFVAYRAAMLERGLSMAQAGREANRAFAPGTVGIAVAAVAMPALPDAVRAGIVAMVRASVKSQGTPAESPETEAASDGRGASR